MKARSAAALVGVTAVGAGAAVARRSARRWKAADSHGFLDLPEGESRKVEASDGAVLDLSLHGPADGPLVVMSHGWIERREVWAPVVRPLVEAGHRVVLFDHRGHGHSTVGAEGTTIDRLADDLADVLAAIDARDAVVVGHSMGGMTIQAFLARHATTEHVDRVKAAVLVATCAHGLGGRPIDPLALRFMGTPAVERALGGKRGHVFLRSAFGREVSHSQLVATRDWLVATPGAVRGGFLEAMHAMDLRPGLAKVAVPVTVLLGSRDTVTPARHGRVMAAAIPGATVIEFPGRGHMLPFEETEAVAAAIAEAAQ